MHACIPHTCILHTYKLTCMHAYRIHTNLHACMHTTYIQTYMHACIPHTYKLTCMHAYLIHTNLHACTHTTYIQTYMHACIPHTYKLSCMHTAYIQAYMHACIPHTYKLSCMHTAYIQTYMHARIPHTYKLTCMHAYICIHTHIYIYIYMSTGCNSGGSALGRTNVTVGYRGFWVEGAGNGTFVVRGCQAAEVLLLSILRPSISETVANYIRDEILGFGVPYFNIFCLTGTITLLLLGNLKAQDSSRPHWRVRPARPGRERRGDCCKLLAPGGSFRKKGYLSSWGPYNKDPTV